MVNNDNDDGNPPAIPANPQPSDNSDTTINVNDDDIIKLTIKRPYEADDVQGSFELSVTSGAEAVRVFDASGNGVLTLPVSVDLSNPDGSPLEALATEDLDIFIECLSVHGDVSLKFAYKNDVGAEISSDEIHFAVAAIELPLPENNYEQAMNAPALPMDLTIRCSLLPSSVRYQFIVGDSTTGHILEYEDRPNTYQDPAGSIDSGLLSVREWTVFSEVNGFYGGQFTKVRVLLRNGSTVASDTTFSRNFYVIGDALLETDFETFLSTLNLDPQDLIMLRAIARSETEVTHFRANAGGCTSHTRYPLHSCDDGYGLFQLTNPVPGVSEIWNWQSNTNAALLLLLQKKAQAIARLSIQGRTYTDEQLRLETYAQWNGGFYHVWNGTQWVEDPNYNCGCNGDRHGREANPPVGACRPLAQCYANFTHGLE